jgi:hypothetical protein
MKVKTDWGDFNVLPCPCCGKEKFYLGHESSTSMAIFCWRYKGGCGIGVQVEYPDELKKPMSEKDLDRMCLKKAVRLWNRRVVKRGVQDARACKI